MLQRLMIAAAIVLLSNAEHSHASDSTFQWYSSAEVQYGSRRLNVVHSGEITASNREDAEKKAKLVAVKLIDDDYPGGEIVPDSLSVTAMLLGDKSEQVISLRAGLMCNYVTWKEEGLRIFSDDFVLASRKNENTQFTARLRIVTPDNDEVHATPIRTASRGPVLDAVKRFNIWKGDAVEGGEPVIIRVSLTTQGGEDTAEVDMGEVEMRVRKVDSRATCEWRPIRNTTIVNERNGRTARVAFRNDGRAYDLYVSLSDSGGFSGMRASEDAELLRKLHNRPSGVSVLAGEASGSHRTVDGQERRFFLARIFVVSDDPDVASAYRDDTFPGDSTVVLAESEDDAMQKLKVIWSDYLVSSRFGQHLIAGSENFRLEKKVKVTNIDYLTRFKAPKRKPRTP